MKCEKFSMLTGTGCDLEAGHDGNHVRTYTEGVTKPYSVTWNEDADRRVIDVESTRKQGT